MVEKYRVHELAKFSYSEIGEYIDENHTDRPLRNDILVEKLNNYEKENKLLKNTLKLQDEELKELDTELVDISIQLDFLKAENMDMKNVLNENRNLKSQLTSIKKALKYLEEQEITTLADIDGIIRKIERIANKEWK